MLNAIVGRTTRTRILPHVTPLVIAAVFVLAAAAIIAARDGDDQAEEDDGHARAPYAIGLWGDLPYSDLQALVGVPNLIADMNRQNLAFTVNDGDLKVGSGIKGSVTPTICSNDLYAEALGYLQALKAPAILTPGDNDWTDCDRPANGGFDSLERLEYERAIFFGTPYSFGQRRIPLDVQTDALCLGLRNGRQAAVPCVENRKWTKNGVTYLTLNIPGSCNNLCDTNPDPNEFAMRNHANIVWMQEAFADAAAQRSVAVMIIQQSDPGYDQTDGTRAPLRDAKTLKEAVAATDGYVEFLNALRDEVIAFRRPVAFVQGDSHYFRIDKPLLDAQGRRLENFTRVETFGDHQENGNNDVNWLKVLVDPTSREVFAYQPQIVPGNRTAVPVP